MTPESEFTTPESEFTTPESEFTTPESPVPPVHAYRPPQTTPFRTTAMEEPEPEADQDDHFPPPGTPQPEEPPRYSPPRPSMPPRKRHSIVGPFILILLGLFLLGKSLGLIHWSLWQAVWKGWPVLLILLGLDRLLGGRGPLGRMAAVIVALAVVAASVLVAEPLRVETPEVPALPAQVGSERVISQPLGSATAAYITVSSSVSVLTLEGADLDGHLVQGSVLPLSFEEIEEDYGVEGDTAYYRLSSAVRMPRTSLSGEGRWDLLLSSAVPISLRLDTGVADSAIDLSRLQVTNLDVNAGLGDVRITLPAEGPVRGRINAGVGQIVIRVPENRAARIRAETGIGTVAASDGFRHEDGQFVTGNFQEGEEIIDLVVSGGIGQVVLETVN